MIIKTDVDGQKTVVLERVEMALILMAMGGMFPEAALQRVDELLKKSEA